MDVTPLVRKGLNIIQAYKGGRFVVSGQSFDGPLVVSPEEVLAWPTQAADISSLGYDDFSLLRARAVSFDVILLGGGGEMAFLAPALKNALMADGLRLETMDTGAACRTYNVLMAEGRRVAAALLPVQ
ncbi:MAG: Mth938-like domain-containing protein [Alphaproteobacteria bacterium]|nr:Mth938-like domain-containing protein [Alphaproteobacteria bacterium]